MVWPLATNDRQDSLVMGSLNLRLQDAVTPLSCLFCIKMEIHSDSQTVPSTWDQQSQGPTPSYRW